MPVILNRRQKVCLWAGISVFLLTGIYPPWYHTSNTWTQYHHSFLWRPPMARYYRGGEWHEHYRPEMRFQLDTRRLYVQWMMIATVTCGLILTFHRQKRTD